MTFEQLSARLHAFSQKEFGQGVSDEEINQAERELGVKLPESYRAFLRTFGWGGVMHVEIFGLGSDAPPYLQLVKVAERERTEMSPPVPRFLAPIMNDGAGNHYCLDTRHFFKDECPVVVWNHELGTCQEPKKVADSFTEWMSRLIADCGDR